MRWPKVSHLQFGKWSILGRHSQRSMRASPYHLRRIQLMIATTAMIASIMRGRAWGDEAEEGLGRLG